jgi:hypothetical protein
MQVANLADDITLQCLDAAKAPTTELKLVFLIGAPRSGTTWLQLLLAQSNLIATCNETHIFNNYLQSCFASWRRLKNNPRPIGLHRVLDEHAFITATKLFTDAVFGRVRSTKPGAVWVLEKTPDHARYGRDILRLYPQASFIHIIRDPRSVVASLSVGARTWDKGWSSAGILANTRRWLRAVEAARGLQTVTPRYYEVRYERLLAQGAPVLRDAFQFLALKVALGECERWLNACSLDAWRSATAKRVEPWELREEPAGFFGSGGALWEKQLRPRDVRVIEALAGDRMEQLSYRLRYRRSVRPIRLLLDDCLRAVEDRVHRWRDDL